MQRGAQLNGKILLKNNVKKYSNQSEWIVWSTLTTLGAIHVSEFRIFGF